MVETPYYVWVREGNFYHRKEVSKEHYFSLSNETKEPVGRNYELVGPLIRRDEGSLYREQQLK